MDKSGIDRCKLILGFMMNLALERFVASKLKLFECTRFNFAKGNLLTFLQLFSTSSIFRYVSQGKKLANFRSVKNPNAIIIQSLFCHSVTAFCICEMLQKQEWLLILDMDWDIMYYYMYYQLSVLLWVSHFITSQLLKTAC